MKTPLSAPVPRLIVMRVMNSSPRARITKTARDAGRFLSLHCFIAAARIPALAAGRDQRI
ncbi:hypothetical protein [Lysobacter gummosus]|uniref:hypothetical protein n=1 Tax=Lysobacter gummosus TaxID=262324 RepID=UPI003629068A